MSGLLIWRGRSVYVPEFTADIDATGVLIVLAAVRLCGLPKTCRVYQAFMARYRRCLRMRIPHSIHTASEDGRLVVKKKTALS